MTPGIALATYCCLAFALFGLFVGSSRRLSRETREHMRRWITREGQAQAHSDDPQRDRLWAQSFVQWFDEAFRVRVRRLPLIGELALPSFARSVFVSLLSLAVLALVWISNMPGFALRLEHAPLSDGDWEMTKHMLLLYGGATLITNWIPDYLSLVESRFIMGKMAEAASWPRRIAYLLVDVVATLAISFFSIHLGMVLLLPLVTPVGSLEVGCLTPAYYSFDTALELFWAGLRFETPPETINYDAAGIYIYSTFLTSLWVWIYLGGGLVLRTLVTCKQWLLSARAKPGSSSSVQPVRAMGMLLVVLFSAVFWPNWAYRRAHSADVYIEHAIAETQAAERLAAELERAGLRVWTRSDVDEALASELIAEANNVILLAPPSANIEPTLEQIATELDTQIACGERPFATVTWVAFDAPLGTEALLPADEYFARHLRSSPEKLAQWALRSGPLLQTSQIRACQVFDGYPTAPASCELRR